MPRYWEKRKAQQSGMGLAVLPLSRERNRGVWDALAKSLHVPHPDWLGHGRDVVEAGR